MEDEDGGGGDAEGCSSLDVPWLLLCFVSLPSFLALSETSWFCAHGWNKVSLYTRSLLRKHCTTLFPGCRKKKKLREVSAWPIFLD
jgi:hypothetical protein